MDRISFRSPEGRANAIWDPAVFTANWHTCPAGAAQRKVTVCWAPAPPSATTKAAARSAKDKSCFLMAPSLLQHHPLGAVLLEDQAHDMNDLFVLMLFAVFDYLVLDFASLLVVQVVLMSEAVVPAAVPGH